MDHTISCPACQAAITLKQLFWTGTLLRFKCPHCATKVQPKDKTFATWWLVIAAALGFVVGVAAFMVHGLARDGVSPVAVYVGLVVLVAGSVAVIKWRASLALIKSTELRIAP